MVSKSDWLTPPSYEESVELLTQLALRHARRSGKYSGVLVDLLERGAFAELLDVELTYDFESSVEDLIEARQCLAFFEKFEPLKLEGVSKTLTAFRKFARTEVTCRAVNERFCRYRLGTPMEYPFDAILVSARRRIARILGPAPSLEDLQYSFGPGATVGLKRKDACFRTKLGIPVGCSNELLPFVKKLLAELPAYTFHHAKEVVSTLDADGDFFDHLVKDPVKAWDYAIENEAREFHTCFVDVDVQAGNLQFVPKDAKKFRTITVEPVLNTLFQQGLGKSIRMRLKKVGVNLDDQSRNRDLARLGSQTNHLATVDFSSASDTIATQMVAFLLPDDWFTLLALARTGTVVYRGLSIKLEKFSTMGNSYTFELESLIFYSLAWAVLRYLGLPTGELSIFGDDLIIPSEAYSLSELIFAYCGFEINATKSFVRGPFRESCGGDFFLGTDIRPYYQKSLVTGETLFTLHNFYMRAGQLDDAAFVRSAIHPSLIIFGPDGYGDGHLIGDWVGLNRRVKLAGGKGVKLFADQLGWDGVFFYTYRHRNRRITLPHHGDCVLPVYSIYKRDPHPLEEPSAPTNAKSDLWADPKYFIVPGSDGYEKIAVYTHVRGVFLRG